MSKLDLSGTKLKDPDRLYQRLVDLHSGLNEEESRRANAQLILLLSNHIGDEAVIGEAIETVRASIVDSTGGPTG